MSVISVPSFVFDPNYGYFYQTKMGTVTMPATVDDNLVCLIVDLESLGQHTLKFKLYSKTIDTTFVIDWGDGSTSTYTRTQSTVTAFNRTNVAHTYRNSPGVGYYHVGYSKHIAIVTIRAYKANTTTPTTIGFPTLYGGEFNDSAANPNWLLEVFAACDSSSVPLVSRSEYVPATGLWSPGCTSLRKVTIKMIDDGTIPDTVLPMTSDFANCTNLMSATIVSFGCTKLAANLFYGCTSLQSLTLPDSWGQLTNIANMFVHCKSLTELKIPSSWGNVTLAPGLFQNDGFLKTIWHAATTKTTNVVKLPSSWGKVTDVTHMFNCISADNARSSAQGPESVVMPDPTSWSSLTSTAYMFANTAITSVDFKFTSNHNYAQYPFRIKNMSYMFMWCDRLRTILNFPKEIDTDVANQVFTNVNPSGISLDLTIRPYTAGVTMNLEGMFQGFGVTLARPAMTLADLTAIFGPIDLKLRFANTSHSGVVYTTPIKAFMQNLVNDIISPITIEIHGPVILTNKIPSTRWFGAPISQVATNKCSLSGGALSIRGSSVTSLRIDSAVQFEIYKTVNSSNNPAILLSTGLPQDMLQKVFIGDATSTDALTDNSKLQPSHIWILQSTSAISPSNLQLANNKGWIVDANKVLVTWPTYDYASYTPISTATVLQ